MTELHDGQNYKFYQSAIHYNWTKLQKYSLIHFISLKGCILYKSCEAVPMCQSKDTGDDACIKLNLKIMIQNISIQMFQMIHVYS